MHSNKSLLKKKSEILVPSISDLIKAKVHIGHRRGACNPKMKKAIFGQRSGIHMINVKYSQTALLNACKRLYEDAYRNKKILFVSTHPDHEEIVRKLAEDTNQHYCLKLLGGIMTNWRTVYSSTKTLIKLNRIIESYECDSAESAKSKEEDKMYGKRTLVRSDIINIRNKRDRLQKVFGGLTKITSIPDTVFVFSAKRDMSIVKECEKIGVNVIGIVDTNCTIDGLNFPIPGNDDSIFSILLYANTIRNVIKQAQSDSRKAGSGDLIKSDQKSYEELRYTQKNTTNDKVFKSENEKDSNEKSLKDKGESVAKKELKKEEVVTSSEKKQSKSETEDGANVSDSSKKGSSAKPNSKNEKTKKSSTQKKDEVEK